MTKVYLVILTFKSEGNLPQSIVANVFTNKKLANTYARYWNLRTENIKEKIGNWSYKVETHEISKIDYSKEVVKLELEKLPF